MYIINFNELCIQKYLNEALRTDKITQDILDGFKAIDKGLSEPDIMKILKNVSLQILKQLY